MIANERQYRITTGILRHFEIARTDVDQRSGVLQPRHQQALLDQYDSQSAELRSDLAEYEALRSGEVLVLESFRALPDALIQARAAVRVSQEELAARLGVPKQPIQRYEATRYAGVSLERVQAVADALCVTIRERIVLPAPGQ